MTVPYDMTPAAQAIGRLLPAIDDSRLGDRTPCTEYCVSALLFHLLQLSVAFRAAALKDLGPLTATAPEPTASDLPVDWRTALPTRLDELVQAWQDPNAWDGQTQVGGVDLPGAAAGRFALNELVIHGWDLARATGQHFEPDEGSARASFDLLSDLADPATRPPIFGPVVSVPATAPWLDRAVGMSGRDPSWQRSMVGS